MYPHPYPSHPPIKLSPPPPSPPHTSPCPIQLFIDPSPSNRTRVINDDHHASTYSNNTQARPSPHPLSLQLLHVSRLRYRRANLRVHQVERHGLSGRNRHGWPLATGLEIFPSPRRPLRPFGCRKLIRPRGEWGWGEEGMHASSSNFCACTYVLFGPVSIWPSFPVPRVSVPPPIF